MANYFVRADGTAGSLAEATGPVTDATACMDETLFNASSFSAGDTVYLSSLGGNLSNLSFSDSGTLLLPITINGDSSATVVTATSSNAVTFTGIEWVDIKNFQADSTYTAGSASAIIEFANDCGTESNSSVNVSNVHVLGNEDGDGFAFGSTAGWTGRINFTDCNVSDCGTTGNSHQAYTTHIAGQHFEINGGTVDNCVNFLAPVGGSTITATGVTVTNNVDAFVSVDGGSTVTINDSSLHTASSTGKLWITGTSGNTVIYNNCAIDIEDTSECLIDDGIEVWILGGTLAYDDATFRLRQFGSGGNLHIRGVTVTCGACADQTFSQPSPIGFMDIQGNFWNGTNQNTAASLLFINGDANIMGNIFYEFDPTNFGAEAIILNETAGGSATVNCCNNVFYKSGTAGVRAIRRDTGTTLTWNLYNNIFVNYTTSIDDVPTGANIDYNCYYNSSDAGGANSITSDPLFVDPDNMDFRLQVSELGYGSESPCKGTGTYWWSGLPSPLGYDGEVLSTFTPNMGAWREKGSFYPAYL